MCRPGTPTTRLKGGISSFSRISVPAPTILPDPMCAPDRMIAPYRLGYGIQYCMREVEHHALRLHHCR